MSNLINRCLTLMVLSIVLSIHTVNAEEMSHEGMNHDAMDNKSMDKKPMDHDAMGHGTMDKNAKETKSMDHDGMDHHNMDMSDMHHQNKQAKKPTQAKLQTLGQIPESGKSREAGFDGRYNMESTSVLYDVKTRCVNASRGLVMLDTMALAKCETNFQGKASGSDVMNSTDKDHKPHMMH